MLIASLLVAEISYMLFCTHPQWSVDFTDKKNYNMPTEKARISKMPTEKARISKMLKEKARMSKMPTEKARMSNLCLICLVSILSPVDCQDIVYQVGFTRSKYY